MMVVIVGNGSPPVLGRLREAVESAQYLIAADGGAIHCARAGVVPDLLIGDLDSIDEDVLRWARRCSVVYRFPKEKDHTDLKLALLEAERMGAKSVRVFSWASKRLDYSLGAVADFADSRLAVEFVHRDYTGFILNRFRPLLKLKAGERLSIFTISNSNTLKSSGLKWNIRWRSSPALKFSQSNEALGPGLVRLQKGAAFVLLERFHGV